MGRPKGSKNKEKEMPKRIKVAVEEAKKPGPKTGGLLPIYQFSDLAKQAGQIIKVVCPKCGTETKTTNSRLEQVSGIRYRWHFCSDGCKAAFRTEQKDATRSI